MEIGKSQETLDSVGLQSSSAKEVDELEDGTGEGDCSFTCNHTSHIQQLVRSARLPHSGALAASHPPLPRFRNAPRIMNL